LRFGFGYDEGAQNEMKKMVYLIPLIITGVLLVILFLYYHFQDRLIYYPYREHVNEPPPMTEVVRLTSRYSHQIEGWFVPVDLSRGTVLFCHGNGGNISHRVETIRIINSLGLNIFLFDYQGYGNSEGKPSEQNTYADAQVAWEYLTQTRKIAPDSIIIWGRSLGGAIATELALHHNPQALILESTFTSLPEIGAELYPYLPVRRFARYRYDTISKITQIHCPLLIIHSRTDGLIPFHHAERLFQAANEPKSFLEIQGDHNHGFLESEMVYRAGIDRFISAVMAGGI